MPRILIADDDRFVVSALDAQLKQEFEIVGVAGDADQAIELTLSQNPDLALLDVQMPGGGGLRATREISTRSPGVAIVALSADESDSSVLEMLEAGAVAYLRKGTAANELARVLRSALAAHATLGS
jgi:DNA-binding NarL/FixJ family response regulator